MENMVATAQKQITERELLRLAERDRGQFYEIAANYGLEPGPGKKIPYLVKRILEESGSSVPAKRRVAPQRNERPKKSLGRQSIARPRVADGSDSADRLASDIEVLRNVFLTLGQSLIEAAESLQGE